MQNLLVSMMPNVVDRYESLLSATYDTLIMVAIAGFVSIALGTLLGIAVVITADNQLYENKTINTILGRIINTVRSIPFIILLALLVPVTRFVAGTSIGIKGALVPMIVGITPFIARQIEQALWEVDQGVVEAAKAMGFTGYEIIWRIMLREALPGIIRALMICIINLIGLSAMAGTVGGGGLGDFAIRYGYAQYMIDITVATVIILLLLVNAVQETGNWIVRKITH